MVAMWDNRTAVHLGSNDYDGYRREMYRTTTEGRGRFSSKNLDTYELRMVSPRILTAFGSNHDQAELRLTA